MITLKIFGESEYGNDVEEKTGRGMHFIVNGWLLSAQAGWGSYCSADPTRSHCKLTGDTVRTDCEIALWNTKDNNMIILDEEIVMGYVKWDMVFDIIEWLRKQKSIPTEKQVRDKVLHLKKNYDSEEE